jgi:hypothetical protein
MTNAKELLESRRCDAWVKLYAPRANNQELSHIRGAWMAATGLKSFPGDPADDDTEATVPVLPPPKPEPPASAADTAVDAPREWREDDPRDDDPAPGEGGEA